MKFVATVLVAIALCLGQLSNAAVIRRGGGSGGGGIGGGNCYDDQGQIYKCDYNSVPQGNVVDADVVKRDNLLSSLVLMGSLFHIYKIYVCVAD
ncbi:hypothetical protein HDU76_012281 [Blyttiomyces sp. JEL0837]|nr:hypothetical protein HDU76_012281 [Blyttiomyces sp. JEL0837]